MRRPIVETAACEEMKRAVLALRLPLRQRVKGWVLYCSPRSVPAAGLDPDGLPYRQRDDGGMSFRFDRGDRRGDVEGKRANCEVYARIAQVQADANKRFRCGLRGPAWESDPQPHFRWCRYVPRRKSGRRAAQPVGRLQRCFDSSETSTMTGGRAELCRLDN